jgi:hypothetical protein
MYNNLDKESVMFQDYYESILTYIDAYQPSVKETVEFLGALTHSIIDLIDMDENEKETYVDIYNRLIRNKLSSKKAKKENVEEEMFAVT